MSITIQVKAFRTAYTTAASVAPARSPKPILQSVKLVVDPDGYSEILGTDLEVGVRAFVAGVYANEACEVVLPPKFGQILGTVTDGELVLSVDDENKIDVRGLRSRFKVATEDSRLYPDVPKFDADKFDEVAVSDLRRLIARTSFATDVESTRYALGGVLYERSEDGETLAFVGTDGRRLARQRVDLLPRSDAASVPERIAGCVIPVKATKLLSRVLSACDADAPVQIHIVQNCTIVRTSAAIVWSRLVEGRYPRYQDAIPSGTPNTTAHITAGELKSACNLVSITTSDQSRGCDFDFHPDNDGSGDGVLKLASQAPDAGSSTIDVPLGVSGGKTEITFDPGYLIDALNVLEPSEVVRLQLIDAKHAAVMRTDDGYEYVIMPMTRDR